MVRLDKIIYMITCFKSLSDDLEQLQYSAPNKNILIDDNILRVMHRIGVTSKRFNANIIREKLIESIPFGREFFLLNNTKKHSNEICAQIKPHCEICQMNEQCDYYNHKNIWEEEERVWKKYQL